jgi:hypothetical protein
MNRRDLIAGLIGMSGCGLTVATKSQGGELTKTVNLDQLPNHTLRLLADIDLDEFGNLVKTYVEIPVQEYYES